MINSRTFQAIVITTILCVFAADVNAEITLTNALAKEIGRAYGFYLGQNYSLNEISRKYPSLSGPALLAEMEFSTNFKSSVEGMDEFMTKHVEDEWQKIKSTISKQTTAMFDFDKISETQAREFIDTVRQRAKGNIESPVLETMLLFKSGYDKRPEKEFVDGYKYKYTNEGTSKAKGVGFSIEAPKTWTSKEGDRPNIIQKFVSENGRGFELLLILIKEMSLQPSEEITEKDVAEILNPKDIKDFLPSGSTYIKSGKLTLENLPGFWVTFETQVSRARNEIDMEVIMYTIFYKNKMIQIQGQVMTSANGEKMDRGNLAKYEKLFDLMANSLVIPDLYQ